MKEKLMSSGENESKVADKLAIKEAELNEYSKSIGLNVLKFCNEVSPLLELKIEELRRLSEQDCGIYAYKLGQYATFLQKEINRFSAKMKWASHNLDITIGKVYHNYGDKWIKYDERKVLVINDSEV